MLKADRVNHSILIILTHREEFVIKFLKNYSVNPQ